MIVLTDLVFWDLYTDMEELTVCLYISIVAAGHLVLAGEGRVRQIVRKWDPGAPHLIWWSFQVVFSVVSSFVSLFDQTLNPKVLKFKIASMEQESDQFRLALDVKVRQLDLWHSSLVLFWKSKVELKFETKVLFCMCSCVWNKNFFTQTTPI